tara:strand:+ start:102932 stop:104002 length:1071 start_codon:yes stop_codon:yes gene_type:complete
MKRSPSEMVAEDRQAVVDNVLAQFFRAQLSRARTLDASYVDLWRSLEANTVGGKRFRPRMVSLAYDALGGIEVEPPAYVGAAFELLHTALIIHDDVIDRDFVRRGAPNIAGTYRDRAIGRGLDTVTAEHRGASAAVIAGDLALFNAYRLIDRSGANDVVRDRLLEVLDEALFASAAGELIDIDYAGGDEPPPVHDILRMVRLKTAVYTFECPLQAGAILAGASDAVVATLGDFGREIGIAFQLVDDLLGVFGAESLTGKTTLGDLREGKRTVLIAYATMRDGWAEFEGDFGNPDLDEAGADRIRAFLTDCGARRYLESLARDYSRRGLERLSAPHVPSALRDVLIPVADEVLERVK